jgi:hypothetical protein
MNWQPLKGGHPMLPKILGSHQGSVELRLLTVGIPSVHIRPFMEEVSRWEMNSGVEWTLKRLKSLKVDLFRRQSGMSPLTWIRKNRKGDIYGTIGSLMRWADKSEQNFGRVVQAFMAYSLVQFTSLTDSQKEKFLSGINADEVILHEQFLKEFADTVRESIAPRKLKKVRPLVLYHGSPNKKAPRLFGRKSVPQDDQILDDLQFLNTPGGLNLLCKYPSLYLDQLEGLSRKDYFDAIASNSSRFINNLTRAPVYGGEIHFLQELGGKLRSIASPLRIHQNALTPLSESLYSIVSKLPWDCTFDQSRAVPFIQSHLSSGGKIHSVDLSSATDHFPLSLQLVALRAIFGNDPSVDLFEEISRASWKSPLGDLQWKKGQPLGLYPSFASFTLTHGLLLRHLAGSWQNQFFVVGDDVVILDNSLYIKYIDMLERMSCPWSTDKSLSSSKLAEFAGKIITPSKVIPQMKWRTLSDENFLDICRLLGRQSRRLLSSRQKRVFDNVSHLCEPIGLNFSLPGDNLVKMVERTLDFYQPEKVVLGSLMGLTGRINRMIYSSNESASDKMRDIISTFDEKVKSALSQTIFARWSSSNFICLESLETLPQALDLLPRLPCRDKQPTRVTTLLRYERLLSKK